MKILEILTSPVSKIINNVIDKIAPDKVSEAEKAQLKMAAQVQVSEALQKEEDNFRNFVIQYEGAAKDMPPVIQIVRGLIRPVVTTALIGFWIWGYMYLFTQTGIEAERLELMERIMGLLFKLNLLSLGFWYGEKALQRSGLRDLLKNGFKGGEK